MNEDILLVLRRIEQAIYGLEKRLGGVSGDPSRSTSGFSNPTTIEFPSFISVEVQSGTVNALIEDQPIAVRIDEQPIHVRAEAVDSYQTVSIEQTFSSSGSATIINGQSGQRIVVYGFLLSNRGLIPVDIQFRDNASPDPNNLTGLIRITANGTVQYSGFQQLFSLEADRSLVLAVSAGTSLGGFVVYRMLST